ncbi:putative ABC transport system ATP-binding protein [Methylomarinovum caldicuralii]|uniref:ABC transport system ATP-binding protein n=1 Tax=Methylomarinovum caldicuralii TaxID=438856 RepID=A0AAU9C0J3_9GAMM|nr:ABC transporter ATP-binding protein [Methylomarinovum caldicuralii]BCX81827.1 putative ABC transport system ATP-binding protein [Methylomarinovum caldicuralii]
MIELEDVWRIYQVGGQPVYALRGINLKVEAGEYLSVMGPSGSGKSTLLHILGLLDRPSRGSYRLDGIETTQLDEEARAGLRQQRIGFVFQVFHLIPRLTARENIELPLMLAGIAPAARRRRVQQLLKAFALENRALHLPSELSGGQRQRVAIARAVAMEPDLILADEPTGNLDRKTGLEVMEVLEALNCRGLTLILVTHDLELGRRAPRRIEMRDGAIVRETRE